MGAFRPEPVKSSLAEMVDGFQHESPSFDFDKIGSVSGTIITPIA
jgi:hypothetical protein